MKNLIFIGVGIFVITGAGVWAFLNWRFVSNAATARGVVVKLNAGGSHPQIKFTTAEGKEIEYAQGGLIFGYKPGDEVDVFYERQNPQIASVDSFSALWGFPILALILGGCALGAGLFANFAGD